MVCEASAVLPLLVVVADDVCGVIVGADEAVTQVVPLQGARYLRQVLGVKQWKLQMGDK